MKRMLLVLLSAILVVLSFPPYDLGVIAWIALVPLFLAIRGESPLKSFLYCYLFGTAMMMGVYYWINMLNGFSPVYFLLLAVFHCAFYAFFGLLLAWIRTVLRWSRPAIAPALWVTMEYLRSNAGFLALPWPNLGNSQYKSLAVIQIASITGVYGVSFLIVMANASIAELLSGVISFDGLSVREGRGASRKPATVALCCIVAAFAYGQYILSRSESSKTVSVSVIQGNIPQGRKWDPKFRADILAKHLRLSEAAIDNGHGTLIVWPETAVPGSLPTDPVLFGACSELSKRAGSYLLVGNAQVPKMRFMAGRIRAERMYNSAFLFSPEGAISEPYRKIRLLPFGEYIPYRGRVPWPSRIASALDSDFTAGKKHTVLSLAGIPICAPICWESLFPDLFRRFVINGAQFAVNLTNEAWFGETAAPYQFLAMNVFRAVENRIAVVRCANTGVSCFIGPTGEIYGRVGERGKDIFVEGFLTKEVPLREETTFYTRHGDLFALCALLLTFAGTLGCMVLNDGEKRFRLRERT